MFFLEAIDELHRKCRLQFAVPDDNKDFCSHIPITIRDNSNSFSFEVRKREKAKLFLLIGKQKIYLSDAQIVNTILAMEDADIDWFLSQFVALYSGTGKSFQLVLDNSIYYCDGIDVYPKSKNLHLFSDSIIDYKYFSVLLNFIFFKDHCWETLSNIKNSSKKTLCKYIVLIDFYHNHSERSQVFLKKINYPLMDEYLTDSKLVRDIFDDLSNIEKFDISPYI